MAKKKTNKQNVGLFIPAEVLRDKRLTMREQMFYSEILQLHKVGGCNALNKHFADRFDVSKARVSQVIGSLAKKKVIDAKLHRDGKTIVGRTCIPLGNLMTPPLGNLSTYPNKLVDLPQEVSRPTPRNYEDNIQGNVQITNAMAETFVSFWEIYPKKTKKKEAQGVWDNIPMDEKLYAKIISAVEIQKTQGSWTKNNGQYIPNPANWLSDERWTDERPQVEFATRAVTEEEADKLYEEVLAND